MSMRFLEWLFLTCLVSAIPMLARLFIWSLSSGGIEPFAAGDVAAYGIALNCVNIYEGSRVGADEQVWKLLIVIMSSIILFFYGLLLALIILADPRIYALILLWWTKNLAFASTLIGGSVFYRRQEARL